MGPSPQRNTSPNRPRHGIHSRADTLRVGHRDERTTTMNFPNVPTWTVITGARRSRNGLQTSSRACRHHRMSKGLRWFCFYEIRLFICWISYSHNILGCKQSMKNKQWKTPSKCQCINKLWQFHSIPLRRWRCFHVCIYKNKRATGCYIGQVCTTKRLSVLYTSWNNWFGEWRQHIAILKCEIKIRSDAEACTLRLVFPHNTFYLLIERKLGVKVLFFMIKILDITDLLSLFRASTIFISQFYSQSSITVEKTWSWWTTWRKAMQSLPSSRWWR